MTDTILLTAAVTPDPRVETALKDPSERLRQYQSAIGNWSRIAAMTGMRLLIVETTGSSLPPLTEAVAKQDMDLIDFVDVEVSAGIATKGKGAIEAFAMDQALGAVRGNLEYSSTIHKITGRLSVSNWIDVVRPVAAGAARVRRSLDRHHCDTRFFSTTYQFWTENLTNMGQEVNDEGGRYLEHVLARRLIEAEYSHGAVINRFLRRPSIVGTSGSTGAIYSTRSNRAVAVVMNRAERFIARGLPGKQV